MRTTQSCHKMEGKRTFMVNLDPSKPAPRGGVGHWAPPLGQRGSASPLNIPSSPSFQLQLQLLVPPVPPRSPPSPPLCAAVSGAFSVEAWGLRVFCKWPSLAEWGAQSSPFPASTTQLRQKGNRTSLEMFTLLFLPFRIRIEIYLPPIMGLRFLTPLVPSSVIPGKDKAQSWTHK